MKVKPGDELRDNAAFLLEPRLGPAVKEKRQIGKKVDIFFELSDFGKKSRLYVEAKDYSDPLRRSQVVNIWSDYSGIIDQNKPASLLIVSRNGLTTDAEAYVNDEQAFLRHQTLQQIENDALGLDSYVRSEIDIFTRDGLSRYYIPAIGQKVGYDQRNHRSVLSANFDVFDYVKSWLDDDDPNPLAILAGYGAGKSSLAKRLMAFQSSRAACENSQRRPVLIRLGNLTRYSSIEGLLGGFFTSEYPIPNFNFHTFNKLNKAGRLLIILDGFDEMKHAMTWSDFRNQIRDLNRLIGEGAKVILLGRPTAFLSLDEHLHVLRGIQKIGAQQTKDVDWPVFSEIELCDFNRSQVSDFIGKYLTYKVEGYVDLRDQVEERITEVQNIASSDFEIFAKPVHLKILVDLASDFKLKLDRFAGGVTRWDLYQVFFGDLSDREREKEARKGIAPKIRMQFLRQLAFWLWTKKGGAVSFKVGSISDEIIPYGSIGDIEPEAAVREFLTGAFLEKKDGDTYYFGHRSFAEFLVAQYLIDNIPTSRRLEVYSTLVTDGIRQFLSDYPEKDVFLEWVQNLPQATGEIHLDFLTFLQVQVGAEYDLNEILPRSSAIGLIYKAFIPDSSLVLQGDEPEVNRIFLNRLWESLLSCESSAFIAIVELLLQLTPRDDRDSDVLFATRAIAALLSNLFSNARVDAEARKSFVDEEYNDIRKLAVACISDLTTMTDDRRVELEWPDFLEWSSEGGPFERLRIVSRELDGEFLVPVNVQVRWSDVLLAVDSKVRERVREHFRFSKSLRDVVTHSRVVRRKPRIP